MLEKNIDMALIGNSYLSYLLSFDLLSKKQKVLILDDERLKYGSLFGQQVSELERVFLKTWGEDSKLAPFINIDRFLRPRSVFFNVDNNKVTLGGNPFNNFVELSRKFPELFINDSGEFDISLDSDFENELNTTFLSFCHRMGRNACRFSSLQNLSIDTFLNHCPSTMKKLFSTFKSNVTHILNEEHDYWNTKSFLYGAKSLYQSRMSLASSDLEVFHLFHCLISPFYILDEKKIVEELRPLFEERGGQIKSTHIREWKFYKQSPWSLELASFEGIIHPKKVALLGGLPEKLPLKVTPDNKCYKNVISEIEFLGDTFPESGVHVIIKNTRIGTDQSLIILDNSIDCSKAQVQQFVLKRKGQKIDFFTDSLNDWLREDLLEQISEISDFKVVSPFKFGNEVFVSETLNFLERSNIHLPKKTRIYDSVNPIVRKRLNNVFYFGPYKDSQLGLLTSMVDIKEAQQFL